MIVIKLNVSSIRNGESCHFPHRTIEVKTNRSVPIMEKLGSGVKVTKLNNAYRLTELPIETKRFQIKRIEFKIKYIDSVR